MSAKVSTAFALDQLARLFAGPETLVVISRVRDQAVVALSPGFASNFGLDIEAAIGRTAVEIGLWRNQHQRDAVLHLLHQQGSTTGEPVSIRGPDGHDYDGLMSAALIEHDGESYLFALIQDVRRYDSQLLARTREVDSFRTLIMESEVGVYRRRGADGALLAANPALARMLGYPGPEALLEACRGQTHFDYVDTALATGLDSSIAALGLLPQRRAELRRADGRPVWVTETARAVPGEHDEVLHLEGTLVDISVQVQAEQALVQSEMLYRNLVENSRDGVFLMQHGRIQFANEALGSILGYHAGELIGASYFDWVAPEDLAAQATRRNARESGSTDTQEYEIHLIRRDGSKCLCAVRAGAVQFRGEPASIGTLRDVTEQRAQQRRLQAAEERYRLLFKHAVLGMFQSTLDSTIIEVNDAMAHMFGYASPEAMRSELVSMAPCYVHPEVRARALAEIARHGQVVGWDFEMYRRDGSRFHVLASARLVKHGEDDPGHLEGSLLDNSARHLAENELKFQAHYDSLTQLPNRRSFEQALAQALQELRAQRSGQRAVMLLDLDRFKLINDSLGHLAGDELLSKLAARLRQELAGRALLARYGGDEFALLSLATLDQNGARTLAERVRQIIATPFQLQGHQVFSGASIGIVLVDDGQMQPEAIMRDVDTAMFKAKSRGGGYAMFDRNMHDAARERLALETDLRFALSRGEMQAVYQPVWTLADRRIVGVEALVRWQHPQRGLLSPAQFLTVAEDAGLLSAIDLLVLDQGLTQWHRWQQDYPQQAPDHLSVNISDRLFTTPEFPTWLADRLRQTATPPGSLHLEITETVFRSASGNLHDTLARLKALGVQLIVDDFGTGYSSLVSFSEAAFDGLKIDRGFIHDLEHNARHRAIVRTIAQFAQDLGLSLVAEGVETEAQARILHQAGCACAQGYLYAPALPAAAVSALLCTPSTGEVGRSARYEAATQPKLTRS